MKKIAALIIFLALIASDCLDIGLSIAPGLSLKNLLLYVLVLWILFESVLDSSGGGIFKRQFEYMSLHTSYVVLILVALFSAAVCIFIVKYDVYRITYTIINLKSSLVDRYLMLFVFLAAVRDSREAVWMVKAMLIAMTAAMVLSLVDMFEFLNLRIMDPRADGRLQGYRLGSNEYGALMAFYLPVAIALAYRARGKERILWGGSAFVFLMVMIFSASRGAIVGLTGGAIIGLVLFARYINIGAAVRSIGLIAVLAVLTVGLLSIEYGDLLYARFVETTMTSNTFDQTSGRTVIWGEALGLMSATPFTFLIGFGWGTFDLLNDLGSHNTYLEYLFELGLIGLGLLVFIFFSVVYQILVATRSIGVQNRLILIGFAFGYLSILVSTTLNHMSAPWLFIWGLIGVVLRLAHADRAAAPISPVRETMNQPVISATSHGTGRTVRTGS